MWIQFDGYFWHGRYIKESDLKNDPKFHMRDSMVYGIYKNMQNDKKQNKNIKNLIRFWEDDFTDSVKNSTVLELIKNKFLEKGIKIDGDFPSI